MSISKKGLGGEGGLPLSYPKENRIPLKGLPKRPKPWTLNPKPPHASKGNGDEDTGLIRFDMSIPTELVIANPTRGFPKIRVPFLGAPVRGFYSIWDPKP